MHDLTQALNTGTATQRTPLIKDALTLDVQYAWYGASIPSNQALKEINAEVEARYAALPK